MWNFFKKPSSRACPWVISHIFFCIHPFHMPIHVMTMSYQEQNWTAEGVPIMAQ